MYIYIWSPPPLQVPPISAATAKVLQNRAVAAATACKFCTDDTSRVKTTFSARDAIATKLDANAPKRDANAPKIDANASDSIPNLVFKKTALRAAKSRESCGLVHRPWPQNTIHINSKRNQTKIPEGHFHSRGVGSCILPR